MDYTREEKFLEYFEEQFKWYDSKANKYKRFSHSTTWILIVLSPVLPVLITFENNWVRYSTIVIATIIAIITGLIKTFRIPEMWVNFRTTTELMRREKIKYDAISREYYNLENDDKRLLHFMDNILTITQEENNKWIKEIKIYKKEIEERAKDSNKKPE